MTEGSQYHSFEQNKILQEFILTKKKRKKNNRKKEQIIVITVLFALALLIRFVYVEQSQSIPTFSRPIMDEKYHMELADQINSGIDSNEPYFRAPLYPHFLAFISKLTGRSFYDIRIIQILLGSLLPILVLWLGLMLFNKTAAYIAAFVAAIYPTFIYYDSSLLITFLMVLLTALLLYQLYRTQKKPTLINFIISGIIMGSATISRPNILTFAPVLIIWVWFILKPKLGLKKALINYAVMIGACIIVILPVTIRNYVVSQDLVLIAWQGGYNFYLGNNREATGWSATVKGIDPSWQGSYQESITIAEKSMHKRLKRSEISDYWFKEGFEEILASPGNFFKLLIKKFRLLINGYEIPNNQPLYIANEFIYTIKPLMFDGFISFPYGLLAPLAIIGIALSLGQWRKFLLLYLFIGSYAGTLMLFFVCARFRQPIIPVLILFAVWGIYCILDLIKKGRLRIVVVAVIAFLALLIESNHYMLDNNKNLLDAVKHYIIGSAYLTDYRETEGKMQKGPITGPIPEDLVKARANFIKTVNYDPNHGLAYNDLATIEMLKADWESAKQYLEKAINISPPSYQPFFNYARIFEIQGDHLKALELLERIENLFTNNDLVFYNVAQAYLRMNQIEKAKNAVIKCLDINPDNQQAQYLQRYIDNLENNKD